MNDDSLSAVVLPPVPGTRLRHAAHGIGVVLSTRGHWARRVVLVCFERPARQREFVWHLASHMFSIAPPIR